jgi:hypothetical protein
MSRGKTKSYRAKLTNPKRKQGQPLPALALRAGEEMLRQLCLATLIKRRGSVMVASGQFGCIHLSLPVQFRTERTWLSGRS